MALLVNIWHLRKVAESSAKPCDICYKPSSSVLITPDNKDHFYICPGHLKDRGFCSPVIDEGEVAAKKKKREEEELEREIEAVKKEYEEKVRKRKKKKKDKEGGGGGKSEDKGSKGKEKSDEKKESEEDDYQAAATKEKDEKIKALTAAHQSSTTTTTSSSNTNDIDAIPRIYTLQKIFHQKRIDRIRNAELAKRNRDRFRNPEGLFPKVPSGELG